MPKRQRGANLKPPGVCVFCGNRPLTKEHIWSDWLTKVLPSGDTGTTTVEFASTDRVPFGEPRADSVHTRKFRQGAPWKMKLRIVCDKCNSGWMSRIVDRTKPIILKLLPDDSFSIPPDDQQQFSTWVALTCVIAEFLRHEDIIIPIAQIRYLFRNQTTSADWSIAVGVYTGEGFYFRYRSFVLKGGRATANPFDRITQEFESDRDNAVLFTFTIGSLLIQAFLSVDSVLFANDYLQWIDGSNTLARIWPHRRLWPFPAKAVKWPPRESVDDNTARALADYYYQQISRPKSFIR